MSLLCTRNQVRYGLWTQKMVLKNFLKLFFKKIWKFGKVAVSLQPLSASKIGKRNRDIKQTSVLR